MDRATGVVVGDSDRRSVLGRAGLQALGTAMAVVDALNLKVLFENDVFMRWFPRQDAEADSLEARCPSLDIDRARRRMDKGRPYTFESELRTGARSTCVRTTLSTFVLDGEPLVLVEGVDITKQKEIEHMLDSYSDLAERKERQLQVANRTITSQRDRMQRELTVARDLQMSMLPHGFAPSEQQCTLYGVLQPARELGGDFFDYFFVDHRRVCLVVGDVSDKGAASALFAAATKTLLKAHAHREASSGGIMTRVNQELAVGNKFCMFVTLFVGILDLDSGDITFTNAGHEPPFVVRPGEPLSEASYRHGPAVGIVDDAEYTEDTVTLRPGDILVVYTDGVTDAQNPSKEVFGKARLEAVISSDSADTVEGIVRGIVAEVKRFENNANQRDDVTILGVGYNGHQHD